MLSSNTSAANGAANYIEDVFSTYTYTGTGGSTLTVNNGIDLSTKGGLLWVKWRKDDLTAGSLTSNYLFDSARGSTKYLKANDTVAQATTTGGTPTFTTSGYQLGVFNDIEINHYSTVGAKYASWTFRKQPKFFDVVTYTGNDTTQNIAHSLGSAPGCVIIKRTDGAASWYVWHRGQSAGYYSFLNQTAAQTNANNTITFGNNTTYVDPTSTQFTVGSNGNVNGLNNTYVAYIFAHDAGGFGLTGTDNVISCGSFVNAGSDVSTTLGYEPQWLMVKNATVAGGNWTIWDNMRGMPVGSADARLYANLSNAETTSDQVEPTATGFTIKGAAFGTGTYIYIAIRRGPMKVPTTGTSVFNTVARTGTGAAATVTGVGFPPDVFLAKARNMAYATRWNDRLRGIDFYVSSATTSAEASDGGAGVTAYTMDGVNISTNAGYNESATTYGNWFFRRSPSFFDEVCYSGNDTARALNHNLNAVPELMIVKVRNNNTWDWNVYASPLGNTKYLRLNGTFASTNAATAWNNTSPTSSVFTLGTSVEVNAAGFNYVAYLFATCAGVSKVGSYTGTGTTKQVDCGFTAGARFVLIKRTDSTGDWYVWDTARGIVSGNDPYLLLNSTAAETTTTDYIDTYSAGFELSSTAPAAINASGGSFIFLAIS